MRIRFTKRFKTGHSQDVSLPMEFRFQGKEVFVRCSSKADDAIPSRKPGSWDGLLELHDKEVVPSGFMGPLDRNQMPQDRDPFDG
ncbi:antitoxin [Rhizobium gallicum]|uniref:antitoxin n=1 Tax=Rhizobium gallicum TaxID=56730 RepID=UPI001EF96436|nr:AbrB/MazE/SpoVT family DNA-binding domain-containing protein [Rhizobium gallicum]ULJ72318.1 AbrB/MazE/SpoVT family DNA-binding domain-containing protein [Rhizobium gallicum]